MSQRPLRRLPLAVAALITCINAQAEYQSPDGALRISGFGTLGAAHSSTNDVDFVYPGQAGGAGTTPNINPDSKLAVQGTYKFSPTVSATTQIMTKYDASASYEPKIDWIFAKWQALPALTLRAGRMGAPFFMISDFRDVGYANTAIRPALDVYGQVPVSQFEGADATYQVPLASATLNATLYVGDAKADYSAGLRKTGDPFALANKTSIEPSEFQLSRMVGLNLSAEFDNGLTLRIGHSQSRLSISSPTIDGTQLLAAATASPTFINGVNDTLNTDKVRSSFDGIGMSYDQDSWIITAEYTKRHTESFIPDTTGWYANVGYRVGKFTPYAGLSRLSVNDPNKSNPLTAFLANSSLPGAVARSVQGTLDSQKIAQRTTTIGVRWDAMSNIAVKAQWDHVTKPADSYGLFYAKDPGAAQAQSFLHNSRRVNVLSLAVDFVF